MLLTLLGHFAVYRARRYRLTRTILRGMRFHQTGSAWRYAICALFWWTLTILTLGLAFPAAQARLEQYKMRHTFFGDLPGRFAGSGNEAAVARHRAVDARRRAAHVGLVATLASIDWTMLAELGGLGSEALMTSLVASGIAAATLYLFLTLIWLVLSLLICIRYFTRCCCDGGHPGCGSATSR